MLETIKSYLVSLGFSVDQKSYGEATKAIDNAGAGVAKFAGTAVRNFAIAGAAVTSFVAAASIGIAKFIGDLAQSDLANEKLARQMWISKDAAASYNNSLKAMGVSLQDLYLSPELMRNFQTLQQQVSQMRPPPEFSDMMKQIRSIQFEFTRMKLEATYALQWIGYYFVKYMSGPIKDIKLTLSDINGIIIKTMPKWTKVVAQVMSWFARMGITTVRAVKDIIRIFDDVGSAIPKNIKLVGAAITALGVIVSTGPIGIIAAALIGIILLLDDFYTYMDGGEAAFGPFWKKLTDFYNKLNDNGTLDRLKSAFSGVMDAASDLLGVLGKILMTITGSDSIEEALEKIGDLSFETLIRSLNIIKEVLGTISQYLDDINDLLSGKGFQFIFQKEGQQADERLKENHDMEGKGFWERMGQAVKELFSAKSTLGDRLWSRLGQLAKENPKSLVPNSTTPPGYMYHVPNSTTTTNNDVTLNQTNNIYGSDPKATADAAQNNLESMYMRNMGGVIK